jgi:hypothetical protein
MWKEAIFDQFQSDDVAEVALFATRFKLVSCLTYS